MKIDAITSVDHITITPIGFRVKLMNFDRINKLLPKLDCITYDLTGFEVAQGFTRVFPTFINLSFKNLNESETYLYNKFTRISGKFDLQVISEEQEYNFCGCSCGKIQSLSVADEHIPLLNVIISFSYGYYKINYYKTI